MGRQIGFLAEANTVLVTTGWHLNAPVAGAESEQDREPLRACWSPSSLFYSHCSAHLKVNIVQVGPENQRPEFFNTTVPLGSNCSVLYKASSALVPCKIKTVHKQCNLFFLLSYF